MEGTKYWNEQENRSHERARMRKQIARQSLQTSFAWLFYTPQSYPHWTSVALPSMARPTLGASSTVAGSLVRSFQRLLLRFNADSERPRSRDFICGFPRTAQHKGQRFRAFHATTGLVEQTLLQRASHAIRQCLRTGIMR